MNYTGNVAVGGRADVRELPGLVITKMAVGPMNNNTYLLRCTATNEQVLIDAGAEPARILDLVGDGGLAAVVTTHAHHDHWGALAAVVAETSAATYAHRDDAPDIGVATTNVLVDGDQVPVGNSRLRAIHLIGHTPGSVALAYDDPDGPDHVFTGDSLFPGGVGRTNSPEDFASLLAGVVDRLFATMSDETWIYPGHGSDTTLGAERPALASWKERGW